MKAVNFAQDICFIGKNYVCLESLYKYVLVLNRNRSSWRKAANKAYYLDRVFTIVYRQQKPQKSTHITTVFLRLRRISLAVISYLSERGL